MPFALPVVEGVFVRLIDREATSCEGACIEEAGLEAVEAGMAVEEDARPGVTPNVLVPTVEGYGWYGLE